MAREPITQKWGLIVDQDRCTGCNACVVACSMENNIPFMGEDNVANGRGMYWIFNKRTWSGEYPDVSPSFHRSLPAVRQRPLEPVCPGFWLPSKRENNHLQCKTAASERATAATTPLPFPPVQFL